MTILANGKVSIGGTPGNSLLNINGGDLSINGANIANGLAVAEARIINQGATLTGVFAGESVVIIINYWGVDININAGGNGDNANASLTKIPYTSSFTINTRSSGTTTGFDTTLFTFSNSGDVNIGEFINTYFSNKFI